HARTVSGRRRRAGHHDRRHRRAAQPDPNALMAARTDNVADPALAAELLLARRGQAYFSRVLGQLPNGDLGSESFVPGWTNARVVAHVALDARATAHAVEALRTRASEPVLVDAAERIRDIDFAATLPPEALRNLS